MRPKLEVLASVVILTVVFAKCQSPDVPLGDTQAQQSKVKICPRLPPNEFANFGYYGKTNKCHRFGARGPCGLNMRFFPVQTPRHGTCDCIDVARIHIFHQESNQCFPIFTQAYCPSGNWLTFSRRTGQAMCEPNPCQSDPNAVMLNGKCVKLGERTPECGPQGLVTFVKNKVFPTCAKNLIEYNAIATLNQVQDIKSCPAGSVRSLSGRCLSSWSW